MILGKSFNSFFLQLKCLLKKVTEVDRMSFLKNPSLGVSDVLLF